MCSVVTTASIELGGGFAGVAVYQKEVVKLNQFKALQIKRRYHAPGGTRLVTPAICLSLALTVASTYPKIGQAAEKSSPNTKYDPWVIKRKIAHELGKQAKTHLGHSGLRTEKKGDIVHWRVDTEAGNTLQGLRGTYSLKTEKVTVAQESLRDVIHSFLRQTRISILYPLSRKKALRGPPARAYIANRLDKTLESIPPVRTGRNCKWIVALRLALRKCARMLRENPGRLLEEREQWDPTLDQVLDIAWNLTENVVVERSRAPKQKIRKKKKTFGKQKKKKRSASAQKRASKTTPSATSDERMTLSHREITLVDALVNRLKTTPLPELRSGKSKIVEVMEKPFAAMSVRLVPKPHVNPDHFAVKKPTVVLSRMPDAIVHFSLNTGHGKISLLKDTVEQINIRVPRTLVKRFRDKLPRTISRR